MFGADLDKTTGSFDISAFATASNQQTSNLNYTINVANTIKIDESIEAVQYNGTLTQNLGFSTFKKYATIHEVSQEWKQGFEETYAVETNFNLNIKSDTIHLNHMACKTAYNLVAGDTLYY